MSLHTTAVRGTFALLGLVWTACADDDDQPAEEPGPERACNGSVHLCDRGFDEVAYVTTHNAMSSEEAGWSLPNQLLDMTSQLEDGVRSMMLDAHYLDDLATLCHGLCQLGNTPLADGLSEIMAFLDENPNEVFSIIFESYITSEDTAEAFRESGMIDLVYAHPVDTPWPTLGEMLDAGHRVVVFSSNGGDPDWHLDVWDYCWDTDYSNATPEDFDCGRLRGDTDHDLMILNHFLTNPTALPELAEEVNWNPFLAERVEQCRQEAGQLPNFVTVDFYSIGDVLKVVDELNR
jgi:hypothetical protein